MARNPMIILTFLILACVASTHVLSESVIEAKDQVQEKNEFVIIDGKTYYFGFDVALSWVEAVRLCASFHMRLVSLETMEKYNTIQNYLTDDPNGNACFWTSGLRSEGMVYLWSAIGEEFASDAPWYTAANQPEPPNSTQNCVCIWSQKYDKLHDTFCTDNRKYICEYPCVSE